MEVNLTPWEGPQKVQLGDQPMGFLDLLFNQSFGATGLGLLEANEYSLW
jgi:hypothetical protein